MDGRIDVITLAVADLERAFAFYKDGLGSAAQGIIGSEYEATDESPAGAIGHFTLSTGTMLALSRARTSPRTHGSPTLLLTPVGSLGRLVATRDEVDAVLRQAEAAGATITDQPHDRPGGICSGYFRDLDGHLWELIWDPQMLPPRRPATPIALRDVTPASWC